MIAEPGPGSKDGHGAADHDSPYRFDRHPSLYLGTREIARLLILRARVTDRHLLRYRRGDFRPTQEDHRATEQS